MWEFEYDWNRFTFGKIVVNENVNTGLRVNKVSAYLHIQSKYNWFF